MVGDLTRAAGRERLAGWIGKARDILVTHDPDELLLNMQSCYRVMRLIDADGAWALPEIAEASDRLIPTKISANDIATFLHAVQRHNEMNPCLVEFLGALDSRMLGQLQEGIGRSSGRVIPEMFSFALVLQNLTTELQFNNKLSIALLRHWETESRKIRLRKKQRQVFRIKFRSVFKLVRNSRVLIQNARVRWNFGNFHLPLNILQAAAFDVFNGYHANARTAWVLSRVRPGTRRQKVAGEGPVHLSADGRLIETGFPMAREWVNLYQSWNLAFGSQLNSFPFYLCKLVIPQVAGYHDRPQQYIWNRTNALMVYLHYAAFATYDDEQSGRQTSTYLRNDWSVLPDKGLSAFWGEINLRNARHFARKMKNAKSG